MGEVGAGEADQGGLRRVDSACHQLPRAQTQLCRRARRSGDPVAFVADALGRTDTRMVEKHYAHLAPNYIHDAIRANLPQFGVSPSAKVQKPPTK